MRRLSVLSLALAASVAWAGDEGEGKQPDTPQDPYMLYSPNASTLRVVPLIYGRLPDLTQGTVLSPSCGKGVDPEVPVTGIMLHEGAVLALRNGTEPGYSRFEQDARGAWREVCVGVWPAGWSCADAADLTGDGKDDLLLVSKDTPRGYSPYRIKIAVAQPDGSYSFAGPAPVIYGKTWWATFSLGDVSGDGVIDLVFHQIPHGGSAKLTVEFLAGRGGGAFDPPAKRQVLLTAGESAHNLVLADFNRDQVVDVFMPPDDDVRDFGQAHIALSQPNGPRVRQASLDLRPKGESWGSDMGAFYAVATDVDLDGELDIVARFTTWDSTRRYTYEVFRGHADGSFGAAERLMTGDPKSDEHAPRFGWLPGR